MTHPPHSSRRRPRHAARAIGIALAFACSQPAAADWLVTRDGHRIETDGPWKVKGRIVVYTDTGGTLSSLRLDEVDLEASEAAGKEPQAPAPPPAEPAAKREQKAPVLVLTNDDIPEAAEDRPAAEIEEPEPELIMYSTDWCGVCRKARVLLAELEADYVEKDIDKSAAARREYVATFGDDIRVPGFVYGGETFTGLRPAILKRWVAEMQSAEADGL